jgi:hypothetical protein
MSGTAHVDSLGKIRPGLALVDVGDAGEQDNGGRRRLPESGIDAAGGRNVDCRATLARQRREIGLPHIKTAYGFPGQVLPNETTGTDDQQPGFGWIHS